MPTTLNFCHDVQQIKNARDFMPMAFGQSIFFGKGMFDDWCAYCCQVENGKLMASMPSDMYYFELLEILGRTFGNQAIYDDCKHIFERSGQGLDLQLLKRIKRMSMRYVPYDGWAYNAYMHVYYGMIAENNRKFYDEEGRFVCDTKLGAAIKINGIYSLLMDGRDVVTSAKECCGGNHVQIRQTCEDRHIYWDDERNPTL